MTKPAFLADFKPALRFFITFVGIYLGGNAAYGLFVEYFRPIADPATILVTRQSAYLLSKSYPYTEAIIDGSKPIVQVRTSGNTVLRVFEGCNGVNVMIVFLAFLIAMPGTQLSTIAFSLIGVIIIHCANLLRIVLLYVTAVSNPRIFYYFHKYLFTALLYLIVFVLWFVWVRRLHLKLLPTDVNQK